jgi:tRNA G18 (ribose-2'-O)-methylase SpoU
MLRVTLIDSFDLPELEPYRTMKRQFEHRRQQIFVAEGDKVVCRLLETDLTVVSILLPEKWLHQLEPVLRRRPEEIQAYVGAKEQLEELTGFSMYQGVLAVAKIPAPVSLEALVQSSRRPILFGAVDGLTSAENLGVLVRNCAAFGIQALLVGETSCSPYLRRAVRSSMGTIFRMPVVETANLALALRSLSAQNIHCIAAHPHTDRRTLAQADFTRDCCVIFGSEGNGVAPEVLEACDEAVAIPMSSGVDSLNVGSAAAVFLYEASRQRGRM